MSINCLCLAPLPQAKPLVFTELTLSAAILWDGDDGFTRSNGTEELMECVYSEDEIWHKGCFKCTTCGMTLSMKTYKGYEKKPYCDAHYPKTVPSAVTDTPDMIRARQNTANQSSVKYHEQYEKMKGTKIDVADDPELKRLMDNTKNQSLTTYHGEQKKKEVQDQHRTDGQPNAPVYDFGDPVYNSASLDSLGSAHSSSGSSSMQRQQHQQRNNNGNGNANSYSSNNGFSYSSSTVQYPQQACQPQFAYIQPLGAVAANNSQQQQQYQQQQDGTSPYSQRIAQQARGTVVYSSEMGGRVAPDDKPVGSIADYDPMSAEAPKQPATPAAAATASGGGGKAPAGNQSGFTVKALYDYSAADKDEVSFKEGDVIVNCQKVDDGWYTGTVQRTLLWGMLPANYVEKITQPTGMFRVK